MRKKRKKDQKKEILAVDTYGSDGLSKIFCLYSLCIAYTLFLKFIITSLILKQIRQIYCTRLPMYCSFRRHKFHRGSAQILRRDEWKYKDKVKKCHFFPKAPPISVIFCGW